jgi:hypothetical protein
VNKKTKIGLVIDDESGIWSPESRAILKDRADFLSTKQELPFLEDELIREGIA